MWNLPVRRLWCWNSIRVESSCFRDHQATMRDVMGWGWLLEEAAWDDLSLSHVMPWNNFEPMNQDEKKCLHGTQERHVRKFFGSDISGKSRFLCKPWSPSPHCWWGQQLSGMLPTATTATVVLNTQECAVRTWSLTQQRPSPVVPSSLSVIQLATKLNVGFITIATLKSMVWALGCPASLQIHLT